MYDEILDNTRNVVHNKLDSTLNKSQTIQPEYLKCKIPQIYVDGNLIIILDNSNKFPNKSFI